MAEGTIKAWCDDFLGTCQEQELSIPPGFTPPIYNVWKKQTKTNAVTLAADPSRASW